MQTDPTPGGTPLGEGHPSDIVAAIYGHPSITLEGFQAERMPGAWFRPALRFVSADTTVADGGIEEALSSRLLLIRWIRRGIGFALVIALVALAFWAGVASRPMLREASSTWYVESMSVHGVSVNSNSVKLLIAPGENLPNGEVLQAVIPERSTYVTDRATVTIQPQPVPTPHSSPSQVMKTDK